MPNATPGSDVASETQSREGRSLVRIGATLFRNRSWLPLPLVAVALVVPGQMTPARWIAGVTLVALGECVRVFGVAAAGAVTRRRSRNVQRLVTYGIFGWVRNPLYVGNFAAWMGFVLIAGIAWLIPAAIALFAIEYTLIVAYEEAVLASIFGNQYLEYKRRVPRWIPRLWTAWQDGPHEWAEAWRAERSTLWQYVALVAAFAIKYVA